MYKLTVRSTATILAAVCLVFFATCLRTSAQAENSVAIGATENATANMVSPSPTFQPGGMAYLENFAIPGRISMQVGETKYPQWGDAVVANGLLCDEIPLGDYFDTIPLPIYAHQFYAEVNVTVYDPKDISIGLGVGDFAQQKYDIFFWENDYSGKWALARWYYPAHPGLQQQSSQFSSVPLWTTGKAFRFALEAKGGDYTLYQEFGGVMTSVFKDTFRPQGNQLALALWGSNYGSRKVCFSSVEARPNR